jgi:hypothetical protein
MHLNPNNAFKNQKTCMEFVESVEYAPLRQTRQPPKEEHKKMKTRT